MEHVSYEVSSPSELAGVADSSPDAWDAAREQLYSGRIPAWLRATGYGDLVAAWQQERERFEENHDAGLEAFLRLLSPELPKPQIVVSPRQVRVTNIQPGQSRQILLEVTNETRGHLSGSVEIVPPAEGLSVEPITLNANRLLGQSTKITVEMQTEQSLSADTTIRLTTDAGTVDVPVSFACRFPRRILYPFIGAASAAILFLAVVMWFVPSLALFLFMITVAFWIGMRFLTNPAYPYLRRSTRYMTAAGWVLILLLFTLGGWNLVTTVHGALQSGWKKSYVAGQSLEGIDYLDAQHIWAVGGNGGLFFSDGASWNMQTQLQCFFASVSATDPAHIWAVGRIDTSPDQGVVVFSDGTNWTLQWGGTFSLNNVIALDPNHVWAVGDKGAILFFDGSRWSQQESGAESTYALRGVSALDPNHVWAVGDGGQILFYNGGGWQIQIGGSGQASTLRGVHAVDQSHVWAVGENGKISFFNGTSWSSQDSHTNMTLHRVAARSTSEVWAVGSFGTTLFFDGSQWTKIRSRTSEHLLDVTASSVEQNIELWTCGIKGTIRSLNYDYYRANRLLEH